MDTPAVTVNNFSLELGGAQILNDVSFSVLPGDYLSIVGPNGAGKTTLLKCLNRVLTGGSGDVRICGTPIGELSQRELAQRVSYVPQLDGRSLPFTAAEFMAMGRYPYLSSFSGIREHDRSELNAAACQAGIEDLLERQLDTLSGGERQKVFIAAALAQGAQIMLLDEPTTFLDYRHQVEVGRLLRHLNREGGKTVLAVTHDLNSALDGCNRALALKQGEIVFDGPPVELLQETRLRDIYRTEFAFIEQPGSELPFIRPWEAL
jgi:iron complex transport system ATP-binding protein